MSQNKSSFIIQVPNGNNILEYYFHWNKYNSKITPGKQSNLNQMVETEKSILELPVELFWFKLSKINTG